MGNKEEEKEEESIVLHCPTHKKCMYDSFPKQGMRTIVQITQAVMFSVFMMGKGLTTEEEVTEEMKGKCPHCYWDKLMTVSVGYLQNLGYPVNIKDIKEGDIIEGPSPTIWKN